MLSRGLRRGVKMKTLLIVPYFVKFHREKDGQTCFIRSDQIVAVHGNEAGSTLSCENSVTYRVKESPPQVRDALVAGAVGAASRYVAAFVPTLKDYADRYGLDVTKLIAAWNDMKDGR